MQHEGEDQHAVQEHHQFVRPPPDVELWANKLQGDWSAALVAPQINHERLTGLCATPPNAVHTQSVFSKLDNMVKVRLLMGCMFLSHHDRSSMRQQLLELADLARTDDDEWVRVMGLALGDLTGQLDLKSVMSGNKAVRDTMEDITQRLDHISVPQDFQPLQEAYMHPDLRLYPPVQHGPNHSHFTVRPKGAFPSVGDYRLEGDTDAGMGGERAAFQGVPSVHARRGKGLTDVGMGMFRPSRPNEALTARVHLHAGAGGGPITPSAAAGAAAPAPFGTAGWPGHEQQHQQGEVAATLAPFGASIGGRSVKAKTLDLGEAILLQQQVKSSGGKRGVGTPSGRSGMPPLGSPSVASPAAAAAAGSAAPSGGSLLEQAAAANASIDHPHAEQASIGGLPYGSGEHETGEPDSKRPRLPDAQASAGSESPVPSPSAPAWEQPGHARAGPGPSRFGMAVVAGQGSSGFAGVDAGLADAHGSEMHQVHEARREAEVEAQAPMMDVEVEYL